MILRILLAFITLLVVIGGNYTYRKLTPEQHLWLDDLVLFVIIIFVILTIIWLGSLKNSCDKQKKNGS